MAIKGTPKMRRIRPLKLAIILLCLLLAPGLTLAAHAGSLPSPTSAFYINDFADILDFETEQYMKEAAAALEIRTTAQLVVVTVSDMGDQVLENYTIDLFRKWGIGSEDKNNGVLIFLDIGTRQSRIEVGYGLEGALPDGKTGRIQDEYMLPYFRENDFQQGLRQGFNALLSEIYLEYGIDTNSVSGVEYPVKGEPGINIPPPVLIIGAIIVFILILIDFKVSGGIFTITLIRMFFRGGGRGGGGGFTRGGGGSAGGGGSSRGW